MKTLNLFTVLKKLTNNNYYELPSTCGGLVLFPTLSRGNVFAIMKSDGSKIKEISGEEFMETFGYIPVYNEKPHASLRKHDLPAVILQDNDGEPITCKLFRSKFADNLSVVYISDNMSGKMAGFPSISTSCIFNSYCINRLNAGVGICAHCFAAATIERYNELNKRLENNYYTLTSAAIPDSLLPHFKANVEMVRFESFGDLQNEQQFETYSHIAAANPHTTCALWTKNPWIVENAIDCGNALKLSNMVIIQSSLNLNEPAKKHNKYIDHVFTVYEPAYIAENNVNITCGARDCRSCRRCYVTAGAMFEEFEIREQLK